PRSEPLPLRVGAGAGGNIAPPTGSPSASTGLRISNAAAPTKRMATPATIHHKYFFSGSGASPGVPNPPPGLVSVAAVAGILPGAGALPSCCDAAPPSAPCASRGIWPEPESSNPKGCEGDTLRARNVCAFGSSSTLAYGVEVPGLNCMAFGTITAKFAV